MSGTIVVTMVFGIDSEKFGASNPFRTETPWGLPTTIALGDALERIDELRAEQDANPSPQVLA